MGHSRHLRSDYNRGLSSPLLLSESGDYEVDVLKLACWKMKGHTMTRGTPSHSQSVQANLDLIVDT